MTDEIFSQNAIRHGEIVLLPIDALPAKAKQVSDKNSYIIGHSETGHHHVLTAPALRVYQLDNELYLDVTQSGKLDHLKTSEKHETKTVHKGFYKVSHKNEYDYFAKKLTRVLD